MQNNNQFLLNLIEWAKIKKPLTSSHDGITDTPVELKLWKNSDDYILFIINHSESKEKVIITLQIENDGEYVLSDLINNEETNVVAINSQVKLKNVVSARDVKVLTIKPTK